MPMRLRLAIRNDIDAIMQIERMPGFENFVGRSSRDFHEDAMQSADYAYLAGLSDDGEIDGFALLSQLTNEQGNICLKRLAVAEPGKGFGRAFLALVVDWVFSETQTHRFWLDHILSNDRARHVYEHVGFVREGIFRQAYGLSDGTRTDLAVMSILRPEWQQQKA
jgi:diamine N-acetyltransferase